MIQETTFKIEYAELARCWVISRYLPNSEAWVLQDTRMFKSWAIRFARKKAGRKAQLVLTVINPADKITVVKYRRFV